jgi:hypothetical protein
MANRKLPRGARPAKRRLTSGRYAEGYLDATGAFQAFEAVTESYGGPATADPSVSYDSGSSYSGGGGSSYDSGSSSSSSGYDSGSSSSCD